MKILMINKFFYIKGGSETYYFALKKLLEEKGHEVIDFSMKDVKNFDSKYSDFFIENIDYNKSQSIFSKIKQGVKIIYSHEAKIKLKKLIKKTQPDIAHLHIFQHQFSSSIVDVLKKYNIPIVYTAHDLKMVCPNYKMLTNGRICEECKGNKYYNCLKNKCLKDSKVKSFIAMLEAYYNKYKQTYNKIDKIITPSRFYKDKFIEFGVSADKIIHIPNFLSEEKVEKNEIPQRDYFMYFGRLSEEKGVLTMIKAFENTDIVLKIVGTGPIKEDIENYILKNECKNIQVLGFKSGEELDTLIRNSKAIILPSEWYENGPYSAIESLKLGKVLIGSDLGGIPELIKQGVNGYIFKNKDEKELNSIIKNVNSMDITKLENMEEESKRIFEEAYTSLKHYPEIIKIYEELTKIKE